MPRHRLARNRNQLGILILEQIGIICQDGQERVAALGALRHPIGDPDGKFLKRIARRVLEANQLQLDRRPIARQRTARPSGTRAQ